MSTRPQRETAYRVFAAEFDDTTLSYAESDEERAPNYVVTPTGARVNRLFVVGVLTEIESVNEEQLRARVVDPTGAFVVYAGQYQPEALSFLERTDPPAFVAVTGKARTFQPEDSDRVFTSIRPESLAAVDAATRDRWSVAAAERTTERTETMRDALDRDERGDALREALEAEGVEASLAAGIPRAIEHYGTTPTYLDSVREMALDTARVVAGEREEVESLDVAPDAGDAPEPSGTDRDAADRGEPAAAETSDDAAIGAESTPTADDAAESPADSGSDTTTVSGDEGEPVSGTDEPATAEATAEPGQASEPDRATEPDESTTETGTDADEMATEPSIEDGEPTGEADEAGASVDEPDTEGGEKATADVDLDDPESFELDDEVREEVEAEFGTDFESAAEVDEPGEADIETPDPQDAGDEEIGAPDATDDAAGETSDETPDADEPESSGEDTTDTDAGETVEADETDSTETDDTGTEGSDASGDTDPETAVVTAMQDLDDGDGADREAVVERVVDEHGLTPEEADDGIQNALMSGECYEPDDDTLKSI
jgi:RPA family protein